MASTEPNFPTIPIVLDESNSTANNSETNNNENEDNEDNDRINESVDNRLIKYLLESNSKSNQYLKSDSICTPISSNKQFNRYSNLIKVFNIY